MSSNKFKFIRPQYIILVQMHYVNFFFYFMRRIYFKNFFKCFICFILPYCHNHTLDYSYATNYRSRSRRAVREQECIITKFYYCKYFSIYINNLSICVMTSNHDIHFFKNFQNFFFFIR